MHFLRTIASLSERLTVKVTGCVALIIVSFALIGAFTNIQDVKQLLVERLERRVSELGELVAELAASHVEELRAFELKIVLDDIARQNDVKFVEIVDQKANVLASSEEIIGLFPRSNRAITARALTSAARVLERDQDVIAAAFPVKLEDKLIGAVTLEMSLDNVHASAALLMKRYLYSALVLIVVALPLAGFLVSRSMQEVKRVTAAACEVANGHYTIDFEETARGEVGELQAAFRHMITALNQSHADRQRAEEELRVAIETAERAQRHAETASQAKTEFLAAMSHELRTPLNAIMGFSNLILDRAVLDETLRRQVSLIHTSGSALLTVVNDVLDFSKIEAGAVDLDVKPFSPTALAQNCLSIVGDFASKKGLRLECRIDPAVPPHLLGDQARLGQVVLNFVNNAIKFTPTGTVLLTLESEPDDDVVERLKISIADTGIGIPKEKQSKLFQRFSQVDGSVSREYGGTGLGLAISKRLIDLMGGEVGVSSEQGKGSTFWFAVPLAKVDLWTGDAETMRASLGNGQVRARILLAEDLEINQEIASSVLRAAGHEVDIVPDGAAAVWAVQNKTYDLVLMDVQMPVMDGVAATQAIRALQGPVRNIPIIAMTANVYAEQVASFKSAGMNDHVGKPFKKDELYAAVEHWAIRPVIEQCA
jgi:signal transduction histidine kinase/CheY-like chemotaxis protein